MNHVHRRIVIQLAPRFQQAQQLLRALGGALLALLRGRGGRARLYLAALRGRWEGYRGLRA